MSDSPERRTIARHLRRILFWSMLQLALGPAFEKIAFAIQRFEFVQARDMLRAARGSARH